VLLDGQARSVPRELLRPNTAGSESEGSQSFLLLGGVTPGCFQGCLGLCHEEPVPTARGSSVSFCVSRGVLSGDRCQGASAVGGVHAWFSVRGFPHVV
jgi:hypothetical protein